MLKAEQIRKSYGNFEALKGVSFTLEPGMICGYLGPNGAGKTTTIRLLTLASRPTSGEIFFEGKSIFQNPQEFKKNFGYVPDTPFLYPLLTGREFLNFVADLRGLPIDGRSCIDSYLEMFDLTAGAEKLIQGYSLGMQKKISIIASILHAPRVLFLDEPTSGLDAISVKQCKNLLMEAKNRGAAIWLTTHILEIAEKLCDRIYIIQRGEIVARGTLEEVKAIAAKPAGNLEDVFLSLVKTQND